MVHGDPPAGDRLTMQIQELAKLWDCATIIIGFRGTEILTSISVFVEDEVPPRAKSLHELSVELSALEDRNGLALCVLAWKEYEPQQIQWIASPCRDFTGDPWAKRVYESYIQDFFGRLTEKGAKIQNLQPENLQ